MNDTDALCVNLQTVSTECEVMYDWFHIYLVHGIANMEIGLLLYKMSVHGFDLEDLNSFTNNFTWPAQFRGGAPRDVFSSRNGDGPLKCSGSETLNARTALRVYILLFVWDTAGLDLKKCCVSFLKLCSVLDSLQSIARGVTVHHLELEQCIVQHLESFKDAHGTTSWIPKCHLALHLGPMLKHHNMLLSCWTHERKHKLCKNFANNRLDTSKNWELSLLQDVLHHELQHLNTPASMPVYHVCLVEPKPASKKMKQNVQKLLGTTEAVYSAVAAVHSNLFMVSRKDVVLAKVEDLKVVAEVWNHFQIGDLTFSVISVWKHVSSFMYTICENPVLVETRCILEAVPFSKKGDSAIVVVPQHALEM